jgi:hypothetical protein
MLNCRERAEMNEVRCHGILGRHDFPIKVYTVAADGSHPSPASVAKATAAHRDWISNCSRSVPRPTASFMIAFNEGHSCVASTFWWADDASLRRHQVAVCPTAYPEVKDIPVSTVVAEADEIGILAFELRAWIRATASGYEPSALADYFAADATVVMSG